MPHPLMTILVYAISWKKSTPCRVQKQMQPPKPSSPTSESRTSARSLRTYRIASLPFVTPSMYMPLLCGSPPPYTAVQQAHSQDFPFSIQNLLLLITVHNFLAYSSATSPTFPTHAVRPPGMQQRFPVSCQ